MKHYLAITLCCLCMAGASAQSMQDKDKSMGEKTGANSMLGITPSTQDFVNEVAISDMFEISSSRLAAQRGDADTKKFANKMLSDHQKTTAQLTSLLKTANVEVSPPDQLDDKHQKRLDKLNSLQGGDFDKSYGQDQIDAHKDAVSLFQRYAKGGDNPALKDWAGKTLPTLSEHLKQAENLPH